MRRPRLGTTRERVPKIGDGALLANKRDTVSGGSSLAADLGSALRGASSRHHLASVVKLRDDSAVRRSTYSRSDSATTRRLRLIETALTSPALINPYMEVRAIPSERAASGIGRRRGETEFIGFLSRQCLISDTR
jgi:hypothetical protein